MAKNSTYLYIIIVGILALYGCKEENSGRLPSLNEAEIYFDCTLSSVSPDGDSICLIGNENGDMYRYDKAAQRVTDTLHTHTDRIYKVSVERTQEGTFYWVGIRNSGLQKYRYENGGLVLQKIYVIPQKQSKYSPYDFLFYGDYIYVGTSHGLFCKNTADGTDNMMEQVYPVRHGKAMPPMQTCGLIRYGKHIYAASDSGLIKYDAGARKTAMVMHKGEKVSSTALEDGRIYSLAGSVLYIDNPQDGDSRRYDLGISAKVFYAANGTCFFISDDRIMLVKKEDIGNKDKYKTVMLRRKTRVACRNIVMCDSTSQQTLLVTENALFRIPYHLDIFCTDGVSTAVCPGDDGVYFVQNNNLFFRKDGNSEARKLMKLPKADQITNAIVKGNTLYYTNGNEELKRKKITGSYIINSLTGNPETVYRTQRTITAIGMGNDGRIYFGIRDSLMQYAGGEARPVEIADNPYVNRLVSKDSTVYIATLNDGIYSGRGGNFSLYEGSRRYKFIHDLTFGVPAAKYNGKPYILTNHFIYQPDRKDSVSAEGFSRLLTADGKTFYAVMEYGVRRFRAGTNWDKVYDDIFPDIRFSPSLSFVHKGNVFLGASSLGFLEITPDGNTQWVEFNHSVYTFDYKSLLFILIIFVMVAGFIVWYRKKEKIVNELCIERDGMEEQTEKKNYMLYAEYDSICKRIENVNPQYAKELTRSGPRDRDSMEERLQTGKAWLTRYGEIKEMLEKYRRIIELRNSTEFLSEELRKDIGELQSRVKRKNFKIEECMALSGKIQDKIINLDIRQTEEETRKRYGVNKTVIDFIDEGFGARIEEDFKKAGTGFRNVEEAICWFKMIDRKWNFIDVAANISEIQYKMEDAKVKVEEKLGKEKVGSPTENIRNEIKTIQKGINSDMTAIYHILSYDRTLSEAIGIKRHKQVREISLSNKEKALLLMVSAPAMNWNTIGAILDLGSIANSRSTYSKVRNSISSIDEETKNALTATKDCFGAYIMKMAGKKR